MFEELGLDTAAQPDNGSNPRPDNRSGWLAGDTPCTPIDRLIRRQEEANFWDPSTQLRHRKKSSVPQRPDGAPNRARPLEVVQVPAANSHSRTERSKDAGSKAYDNTPRPEDAGARRFAAAREEAA